MADNTLKLFGFEIKRSKKTDTDEKKLKSIVPPVDEDGAGYVTASGTHFAQYVDIDGDKSKDNAALIQKYRGISMHPEVDAAIEDIMNEAISGSEEGFPVELVLDDVDTSKSIKNNPHDSNTKAVEWSQLSDGIANCPPKKPPKGQIKFSYANSKNNFCSMGGGNTSCVYANIGNKDGTDEYLYAEFNLCKF